MSVALGIIGFGIMGERLLRAALNHDPSVLRPVTVWDPTPEAAARLNVIAPGVPMLESAAAVIAACDCLYIASPPASHLEHARAAFAAGRAAFLEKPLSTDAADAEAFVTAAEHSRARAAVNFPMASSPAVAQLAAWRAAIGAPRSLAIECFFAAWPRGWQRDAHGWLDKPAQGGFTREVISHFLFLTRRQLGPLVLEEARARFDAPGRAETAIAARLTAGGVPVALAGGVGVTLKDDHNAWTLEAPGGAIRLRDWSFAERRATDGTWQQAPDALPNERMRPLVLKGQLDKVAAMTRGEAHGLATLREAFEVQQAVEAILAART